MEKSSLKTEAGCFTCSFKRPLTQRLCQQRTRQNWKTRHLETRLAIRPTHQGQQYPLLSLQHTWVSAEDDKWCAEGLFLTFLNGYRRLHVIENELLYVFLDFPGSSVVKNPPADAGATGDTGLIPGLGRSPGGGKGNLFQYSCLENPMERGARQATVHGVTKSQTWLSNWAHTHIILCWKVLFC